MLPVGTPIFLLIPDSSTQRVLHPGRVTRCENAVFVAELDEPVSIPEGSDLVVFFALRNKFVQQGALVAPRSEEAIEAGLTLKLVGEAVSAENRQTYRVSAVMANQKAIIAQETNCQIVDVSPEGFAAIARSEFTIGSNVQVDFSFEGKAVFATARVQTVKTRADGKFRYGFLIADKASPARKVLAAISISIQRQQLKRLAAA